jgi:hypothetical protein
VSTKVARGTFTRWCRRCGWKATYDTAGKADYAKRRHSCERWTTLAARNARGKQIRAATDRTPKPCHHKITQHVHGTYACYTLDRCRCFPCAAAVREYEQNRVRQHAYGRWDNYVDATPAREHVRALMDAGMGWKRIAAAAGVASSSMWKLLYGQKKADGTQAVSRRIVKANAEKLLAVRLDLADGACVSSLGATRRIQALVALGWSQSKLAGHLDIGPANFTPLAHGRREAVTVAHDRAVRVLYEELSMRRPPEAEWRDKIAAARSRNYAKARGWLPPLAWDDEHLDDPAYQPAVVDKAVTHDDETDEAAIHPAHARRQDGPAVQGRRRRACPSLGRLRPPAR